MVTCHSCESIPHARSNNFFNGSLKISYIFSSRSVFLLFYQVRHKKGHVLFVFKTTISSTSIYYLVLIYVCHFHNHQPLTFPQILLISSYKPSYSSWTIEILVLTSWIPASKNFDFKRRIAN